jgi:hypothetical protein
VLAPPKPPKVNGPSSKCISLLNVIVTMPPSQTCGVTLSVIASRFGLTVNVAGVLGSEVHSPAEILAETVYSVPATKPAAVVALIVAPLCVAGVKPSPVMVNSIPVATVGCEIVSDPPKHTKSSLNTTFAGGVTEVTEICCGPNVRVPH